MSPEKLKKDRKRLKKIDFALVRQSFFVYFCHLFIYCTILLVSDIVTEMPRFAFVIGFGFLVLMSIRVFLMLKLETLYARGPQRWRLIFQVFNACQCLTWSIFAFFTVMYFGNTATTWLVVLSTLGLAVYHSIIWTPYIQANKIYHIMTLVPLFFACLLTGSQLSMVASAALLVGFVGLMRWSTVNANHFWHHQLTLEKLKDTQHMLAVSEAKLARIGEVRVDMMTDLSYEVRTPMNSVLGMLTLLSDMRLSDNQREIITVAQHAGQHLLGLIDDIMDFSRIAAGSIVLDSAVFNLRKCFDETLETIGPFAHSKSLELSCCFDDDLPLRVRGDKSRLMQVVSNLINNAIKFSDQGEIVVSVHMVRLSSSEGLLRVQVSDQGSGISSQQQDELFRAFHKADSSTARKQGGTGLGLAICKGLVEAMKGQIGLISEEGKGSTFWFTAHLRLSTQQTQKKNQLCEFADRRVLIYGAPSGMSTGIVKLLRSWRIDAEVISGDYHQALKVLREAARHGRLFDVCMLNFGFRYHGALKLSKIIREDPQLKACKQIVLLTLEQRSEAEIKNYMLGFEDVVLMTKPIQSKALRETLDVFFYSEQRRKIPEFLPKKPQKQNECYHILLVEDNKVNQMVEKGMLKRLGYSVSIAEDGQQAIELIGERTFDAILMDCQMPNLDGCQATIQLRSYEELKGLSRMPVIAMTANAIDGEETRCFASGMDDLILKPVDIDELQIKLRRWLVSDPANGGIMKPLERVAEARKPN